MAVSTELQGIHCKDCNFKSAEPVTVCPSCGSESLDKLSLKNNGTVYTFTVVHVGFGHMAERAPYVLAIVETEENIKLTTVIEDVSLDQVSIGMKVKFKYNDEKIGPVFQPT